MFIRFKDTDGYTNIINNEKINLIRGGVTGKGSSVIFVDAVSWGITVLDSTLDKIENMMNRDQLDLSLHAIHTITD